MIKSDIFSGFNNYFTLQLEFWNYFYLWFRFITNATIIKPSSIFTSADFGLPRSCCGGCCDFSFGFNCFFRGYKQQSG